jgi:hypothetical protein
MSAGSSGWLRDWCSSTWVDGSRIPEVRLAILAANHLERMAFSLARSTIFQVSPLDSRRNRSLFAATAITPAGNGSTPEFRESFAPMLERIRATLLMLEPSLRITSPDSRSTKTRAPSLVNHLA